MIFYFRNYKTQNLNVFQKIYQTKIIQHINTLKDSQLCYEDMLHKIRKEIGDYSIWVSIDETIDIQGCYVECVIFCSLS